MHESLTEKKTKTNILTIAGLNLTYTKWSWTKDLFWLALYENYINGATKRPKGTSKLYNSVSKKKAHSGKLGHSRTKNDTSSVHHNSGSALTMF